MAQGNVEVWLGSLMNMAQKSLHNVIRQAHFAVGDTSFQLLEFLNTFPAQVTIRLNLINPNCIAVYLVYPLMDKTPVNKLLKSQSITLIYIFAQG